MQHPSHLALASILLLGACGAPSVPASQPSVSSAADATDTEGVRGEWLRYANSAGGYSLEVPSAWKARENGSSVEFLYPADIIEQHARAGIPGYFPQAAVMVVGTIRDLPNNASGRSLREWASAGTDVHQSAADAMPVPVAGTTAYRFLNDFSGTPMYYLEHAETVYLLTIDVADEGVHQRILSSFRLPEGR